MCGEVLHNDPKRRNLQECKDSQTRSLQLSWPLTSAHSCTLLLKSALCIFSVSTAGRAPPCMQTLLVTGRIQAQAGGLAGEPGNHPTTNPPTHSSVSQECTCAWSWTALTRVYSSVCQYRCFTQNSHTQMDSCPHGVTVFSWRHTEKQIKQKQRLLTKEYDISITCLYLFLKPCISREKATCPLCHNY